MVQTLTLGRAAAVVDPEDGGRLTSLALDGHELLGRVEPAAGAPVGWFHGMFPMAPYAGRIKDSRFQFDGTTYELPPNNGTHAGHGLVFDVPWQVDGEATGQELTLRTDLDDRWPLGGRVVETFTLSATGLSVRLALSNEEQAMPASLGFHPWFRREVGDTSALLAIRPRQRYAPATDGFPRLLGDDLGTRPWDDVFENMEEAPTIRWGDGPSITLTADSTTWTVYEQRRQAFCVEPLTAPPDTLGTPRAAVIRPGHPLALTIRIMWRP